MGVAEIRDVLINEKYASWRARRVLEDTKLLDIGAREELLVVSALGDNHSRVWDVPLGARQIARGWHLPRVRNRWDHRRPRRAYRSHMRSAEMRDPDGYEREAAGTHFLGFAGIQFPERAQDTCLRTIGIDRAFWECTRLIWGKARRIGLFVRNRRADECDLLRITLEIERWFWVGYATEGGGTGHLEVRGGGLTENHGLT